MATNRDGSIQVFDIRIDTFRPITLADVNLFEDTNNAYGNLYVAWKGGVRGAELDKLFELEHAKLQLALQEWKDAA